MSILIIGGSGVIGYYILKKFLKKKIKTNYTFFEKRLPTIQNGYFLDITKKQETIKIIKQFKPEIVIHTAGLTNVDKCENEQDVAENINVEGTKNIIEGCKECNSKLMFFSTSAVFNGEKTEYSEEDKTSPISFYGKTKLKSEEFIRKSGLPYNIIRIDQPYYWVEKWHHTNSVIRILDALKENGSFREVTDWFNTPTYIPDIINATSKLISLDLNGIYHVVGSDFVNRYQWALLTAEIFQLNKKKIIPINSNLLNVSAKRANVKLSNKKFETNTGVTLKGIKNGLQTMKEEQGFISN